jgi:ATP-binding cassette subfamily B protein
VLLGVDGQITAGTVLAFAFLVTLFVGPVQIGTQVLTDAQNAFAGWRRVIGVLDTPADVVDPALAGEAIPLPTGPLDVTFADVGFAYPGGRPVLRDVDLHLPATARIAVVGETGSGKTTLAYLAARLYDVERGSVSIGGVDVRDLSFRTLTDLVGVVSQETYLFHASVRENLRFAKPDATDEEIERAAQAARIHHVIAALPEGYDTVVGERGYRFSGGEKQRIAIARTILRNPPILVLDEATSSLDNETERLVQEALDGLAAGRTTIAIAHRLSTIRDADQIVVLDRGEVVERGTHDELILAGGRYTSLAARDDEIVGAVPAG